MSATASGTPKPAIAAATSIRDVLAAAENDTSIRAGLKQELLDVLSNRSLLGTRTFWVTGLTPIVAFLVSYYGLGMDGATTGAITTALGALAAWVMRTMTSTGVATVLPKVGS